MTNKITVLGGPSYADTDHEPSYKKEIKSADGKILRKGVLPPAKAVVDAEASSEDEDEPKSGKHSKPSSDDPSAGGFLTEPTAKVVGETKVSGKGRSRPR